MYRSPVTRLLLTSVALDALFTSLVAYSFLVIMDLDAGAPARTAVGVMAVVWVLKVSAWTVLVSARLRPLAQWDGPGTKLDDAALRRVARTAYRTPFLVGISWAGMFAGATMLGMLVLYFGFADTVPLGPRSLEATGIVCVGILLGASELTFPLAEWLMAPLVEQVSLTAIERRVHIPGRGLSYRSRLTAFALTLALAPSLYITGVFYMNDARTGQQDLARRAELAAAELALGDMGAARRAGGAAFVLAADGTVGPHAAGAAGHGREAGRALRDRPALRRDLARAAAAGTAGSASHPREGAVAFRAQGDFRIGVVIPEEAGGTPGTMLVVVVTLLLICLWGPLSAVFIAGSTATPISRVSEALARVGEGQIEAAPRVPVFHQDEVGTLAENYNIMIDQLRELTRRAGQIARGALDVDLGVRGELGEVFRDQLASLREIVSGIVVGAAQLAGAAGEMYAAAQEQEQSAHQQSAGIEQVSRTMESLLEAATSVTESTMGVLSKAERTRETTARTAERIAELSAHAGRIGEILEVIREIANRSDLLALNASLEGTRAGEAGRGFSLVAAELRKLAERITASVADIKGLVGDVRASVAATVSATEESGRLAEGTTESAREINLVTQQQRTGTEQAGQSMRGVASMVTQSLAATQQIRTLAEDLKAQADNLTGLVSKFRLPPPPAALPGV